FRYLFCSYLRPVDKDYGVIFFQKCYELTLKHVIRHPSVQNVPELAAKPGHATLTFMRPSEVLTLPIHL
ncbi:MAG: hypothetical protein WB821_00320, partial [Burkholderiaceae bacterium]